MRRLLLWGALLATLVLAAAGGWVWFTWSDLEEPYKGYEGDTLKLEIAEGSSARRILQQLESQGVIADALWSRIYLTRVLDDPTLKAGEYEFEGALTAIEVLDKLVRGDVVLYEVTLIEGLDLFDVARHLAEAGFGEEGRYRELLERPDLVADLDPAATNLEGYLFPDTYRFPRGADEAEVVSTLVAEFRRRFERDVEPLLDPESGVSIRDLVTLASIVEKETSVDDERPVVAGVYTNRLARGMGLYADPTVIYGLKLEGTWDGNLRRTDLERETPYNTYRIAGLPPGPICSPGAASLVAAARPAEVPYLYFVSRNDGTHVFSRTLAEHNRNVETWQKRYWRERWARERAQGTDSG